MKVLITGFEPFGGEKINPSLEAVMRLENEISGAEIIKRSMPVVFGKCVDNLIEIIESEKPDIVIGVGQAGGLTYIGFERYALNLMDAHIGDNENNAPEDQTIYKDGENAYFSNLPIKKMIKKINENNIPASISHAFSAYVCNNLTYGLLYHINRSFHNIKGGFIHVPFIPEQVIDKPGKLASMSLDDIVKGLTYAIQAVVEG